MTAGRDRHLYLFHQFIGDETTGMAWVRIHDGAMQDMKIAKLSDTAFRLWVRGLCYCQTGLTDGLIPNEALRDMGARKKDIETLATVNVDGRSALWDRIPGFGFKVHDFLDWNDSREKVIERQGKARVRRQFYLNHELRTFLRQRDGDACRYCGNDVNWFDRRGPRGATYDHVDPEMEYDNVENLVVACRGCNSKKGSRTPQQAGMVLLPSKAKPRLNLVAT